MKDRVERSWTLVAAWALLVALPAPQPRAGQLRGLPPAHPVEQRQATRRRNVPQRQTFEGKITRSGGKLVLQGNTEKVVYQLDDQQLAAFFEGKEVKVTGTLDSESWTIYVSDLGLLNPKHTATRTAPQQHKLATQVQYGVASWYDHHNQGHWTASGEAFDDRALTAAHRRLPLGTRVRVTNLRNGRSVLVRINDRGPFIPGRLIDLSKAAAQQLGFTHQGLAPVRASVVSVPGKNATT